MKIILLTAGSRGDVQPYLALGLGLQAAGHAVTLATHASFAAFVTQHGLAFAPLAGDPRELIQSAEGQAWLASAHNPWKFLRALGALARPLIDQLQHDMWQTCQGFDAVIFTPLTVGAMHCAERLGIPCIGAFLVPFTASGDLAHPFVTHRNVGSRLNRLTYAGMEWAIGWLLREPMQRWRTTHRLAPLLRVAGPFAWVCERNIPVLHGYSKQIIPRPVSWPDSHHVTGYWFLDEPTWEMPEALANFLAAGPPPVYVGFGSMVHADPAALTGLVVEALRRAGLRAVLLGGWGSLLPTHGNNGAVFYAESAPHRALFPHMAAVVHHGGAGTTSAALRAGVPQLVLPFFADQPFWGARVHRLRVGPAPILQKTLTVEKLSRALCSLTSDAGFKKRAAAIAAVVSREKGIERAVAIVQDALATCRPVKI